MRNLSLFAVLLVLLVGTYFFQEKRTESEYKRAEKKDLLIPFEINHLKLPHVDAIKKQGQWWYNQQLLSYNIFKQIEKKLSDIKKIKEINGDWKSYSENPFNFKINQIDWSIGDLSLDKQAFYIRKDKKIFLAVIDGESTHLTQNAEEIESIKLKELLLLLSKNQDEFKETQLFRYFSNLSFEKIYIDIIGNLPYELDLSSNTTLPPPIKGISVQENIKNHFMGLITQATIKKELQYSDKLKFKKLGTIVFDKDNNKVQWQLWLKNNKSADAIIIEPFKKKAFLMVGGTLKAFFVHLQDYWDKKVIPQKEFTSFDKIDIIFYQGSKKANLTLFNREPLKFETKGYKIDELKMDKLIKIIFNLVPEDQADRVSILSSSEKKQFFSGDHLRIEVMGQELILWRKYQELIVANLTQGFKAHFTVLDENFRATFEDMLK